MLSASKNNNFANLETWLVNKECLNVKITALIGSKTTIFYFSVSSDITWHAKVIIYVFGKVFLLSPIVFIVTFSKWHKTERSREKITKCDIKKYFLNGFRTDFL